MVDMLEYVRARLLEERGMQDVEAATGISVPHLYRIRRGEGDPGYSKVAALYAYFRKRERK